MRIAVTGASGQLGAVVVQECQSAHEVIARLAPDAIVNCAADNRVDAAEDHPLDALNANAFAVRALARAATRLGATLVHYGSDFVFDGKARRPYREEDRANPLGVYAASKLLGEWFGLDAPRAYVLRVESLFGRAPGGRIHGSVETIRRGLLAGTAPAVFEDRTVSPTYVIDGARATRQLLESQAPAGLYHCVNSGCCTWLEFARAMAARLGVEPKITPVRMAEVTLRARRPQFCALSNEKLRSAGIEMPSWQDALERYLRV